MYHSLFLHLPSERHLSWLPPGFWPLFTKWFSSNYAKTQVVWKTFQIFKWVNSFPPSNRSFKKKKPVVDRFSFWVYSRVTGGALKNTLMLESISRNSKLFELFYVQPGLRMIYLFYWSTFCIELILVGTMNTSFVLEIRYSALIRQLISNSCSYNFFIFSLW